MQDFQNNDVSNDDQAPADDLNAALNPADVAFVAEEKKTINSSTLLLLAILLLSAAGACFMYLRTGPASAGAAPLSAANQTINQFLDERGQNIARMHQMLQNTEKIVQQFARYPSVSQVPLEQLGANPFSHAGSKTELAANGSIRKQDLSRSAALKAAAALNLQSILFGLSRRACMINNTLCLEGQKLDSVLVERITPNSVIVKAGAYRFELKMPK